MRKHALHIVCLCLLALTLNSCGDNDPEKWKITLEKDSKKPYGTYLAFESLNKFFPGADIKDLSRSYRFSNMDENMRSNATGINLMILNGINLRVSEKEWDELRAFVREGNELVIFGSSFDEKIEKSLGIVKESIEEEMMPADATALAKNKSVLSLGKDPIRKYGL